MYTRRIENGKTTTKKERLFAFEKIIQREMQGRGREK